MASNLGSRPALLAEQHHDGRDHRHLPGNRRNSTADYHWRAHLHCFLPDPPLNLEFPFIPFTAGFPFVNLQQLFAWLQSPFTVMPIQVYNWVALPDKEFHINAAAAGTVLLVMTLSMNTLAIYLRYRFRKGINGRRFAIC